MVLKGICLLVPPGMPLVLCEVGAVWIRATVLVGGLPHFMDLNHSPEAVISYRGGKRQDTTAIRVEAIKLRKQWVVVVGGRFTTPIL